MYDMRNDEKRFIDFSGGMYLNCEKKLLIFILVKPVKLRSYNLHGFEFLIASIPSIGKRSTTHQSSHQAKSFFRVSEWCCVAV